VVDGSKMLPVLLSRSLWATNFARHIQQSTVDCLKNANKRNVDRLRTALGPRSTF
jgi:hypothetical protein